MSAALVLGLVTAPPEHGNRLSVVSRLIQLPAVNLIAATTSYALDTGSSGASAHTLTADEIQTNRSAAATTDQSFWDTPLGGFLIFADILVLPIWFLFTPITLPLSMLAAAAVTPNTDSPLDGLLWLIATGVAFLTGPIGTLDMFIRGSSTPDAAAARSAASIGTAPAEPLVTANVTATPRGNGQAIRNNGWRHAGIKMEAAKSRRSVSSAAAAKSPGKSQASQAGRSLSTSSKSRAIADAGQATAPLGTAA